MTKKYKLYLHTQDGKILQGKVSEHTEEEIEAFKLSLADTWNDTSVFILDTEDGFVCIPMDNLSALSFMEVKGL